LDIAKRLLDAAGGLARIFTLAPEQDEDMAVTRFLASERVCVSAGHCDASLDQLRASIDAGLSMFTHLGNGCPPVLPRHDNVIQRVLGLCDRLWTGFIADGVHVPFFVLANYLKCCGIDRAYIVTDAISGAGLGPGEFMLGDRRVLIDDSLATWSADRSHLIGSAGTMPRTAENLRGQLQLSESSIRRLLVENPRAILKAN
jgi:N-acetylglucosamine-6-phosphate deacetylase